MTPLARLRENVHVIHAATCGRTSSGMPICRPECEQLRADLTAVLGGVTRIVDLAPALASHESHEWLVYREKYPDADEFMYDELLKLVAALAGALSRPKAPRGCPGCGQAHSYTEPCDGAPRG